MPEKLIPQSEKRPPEGGLAMLKVKFNPLTGL